VILSDPDVEEGNDEQEATAVTVYRAGAFRQRSYGFGAKHELAPIWVKSWALAVAWKMIKEGESEKG
jgi:hypothetical protein